MIWYIWKKNKFHSNDYIINYPPRKADCLFFTAILTFVKKIKRIPFPEFKKIYSRVPRLCVEVVLIENNKVLLIKRTIKPAAGLWHTPGGTVLKGESLSDTVRRVAKEETGSQVRVIDAVGLIEYRSFKNHYSQDISVAFLVKRKKLGAIDLDGHADKYDFFDAIPSNTIKEQRDFLVSHLGFAKGGKID